ncbi:DUF5615 family PIN-like protein [Candidatus Sumerlaeota bacterium]|nr:DUF5615 family PIN-like protein [Candidatus Sumerlaeota bacterium]MBI3736934.1 DUF5615 family PIN-like protein [Candidatus Sumerlaeota bacterium]
MKGRIRFYLDENIPKAVCEGLRRRGIDVLSTVEASNTSLSDLEQLRFAAVQSRILVSKDPDFLAISARGVRHAGIAFITSDRKPIGQIILGLVCVWESKSSEAMSNQIEYI